MFDCACATGSAGTGETWTVSFDVNKHLLVSHYFCLWYSNGVYIASFPNVPYVLFGLQIVDCLQFVSYRACLTRRTISVSQLLQCAGQQLEQGLPTDFKQRCRQVVQVVGCPMSLKSAFILPHLLSNRGHSSGVHTDDFHTELTCGQWHSSDLCVWWLMSLRPVSHYDLWFMFKFA